MDKVAGSGVDEFFTPEYAVLPLLKYIPKDKHVWCPFDTEDSKIVNLLRKHGNQVTATHLSTGHDFFTTVPYGELVVSNPPYSKKGEVFQRLFDIKLPFAMLVGVVGLFESDGRFNMFAGNPFEIMYMNRRVSYFKDFADPKPLLNPPFSSVWLTSQLLPAKIIFERIDKSPRKEPNEK